MDVERVAISLYVDRKISPNFSCFGVGHSNDEKRATSNQMSNTIDFTEILTHWYSTYVSGNPFLSLSLFLSSLYFSAFISLSVLVLSLQFGVSKSTQNSFDFDWTLKCRTILIPCELKANIPNENVLNVKHITFHIECNIGKKVEKEIE